MILTNEKGVTLQALIITIVLLLIVTSIGATAGTSALEYSKYSKLKTELQLLQTKVNELNENNDSSKGQDLNNAQKEILEKEEVKSIIYKGKEDKKDEVKNGFKFFSVSEIKSDFDLSGIERSYLINVDYRYVVSCEGFKYKNVTYYMIDQMDDGMYNVEYHNKNSNTGAFEVSSSIEGNVGKIIVSINNYDGYINNWQVKYKLNTEEKWQISNDLEFTVDNAGTYIVNVVHSDEIDLGKKTVTVSNELGWNQSKKVNSPRLMTGLNPIKFSEPDDSKEGQTIQTNKSDINWYDYDTKKWANTQTKDGSMWVWIPRYAYKINKSNQTFDVVFLVGTTDNYYDKDGKLQTAKRQTSETDIPDATKDYVVHPAFTNESNIGYVNGGWKKELTGIWVSKFEAGYAGGNNNADKVDSKIKYSQKNVWASGYETETGKEGSIKARNFYNPNEYDYATMAIKYPTFQGLTYSMNYINHSDAFSISRALTDEGNIYKLSNKETDSHLIKNSEWGAVSYLGQSQYGLNGTNIRINNLTLNNSVPTIYAVTGYAAKTLQDGDTKLEDARPVSSTEKVYKWTEKDGQTASCTGTIYGIYDMSGGTWERSAAIVNNGNDSGNLNTYGKAIMNALNNGKSSEYVTVYPTGESKGQSLDDASKANYAANTKIYGDAIRETSTAGLGQTSWYSDYSYFVGAYGPFFARGGYYWHTSGAGLFYFIRDNGTSNYGNGFRSVLVAQ